jgi:hypothetical protein
MARKAQVTGPHAKSAMHRRAISGINWLPDDNMIVDCEENM